MLTERSLTIHPAANGYLVGTLGRDKGGEERNWPPYLTCRWLSISVLSNRHSPTYDSFRAYLFDIFAKLEPHILLVRKRNSWRVVLVISKKLSTIFNTFYMPYTLLSRIQFFAEPQHSLIFFLKLFLNVEDVTTSENQRIIVKYLLISYLIIKQKKVEQNNKYFIGREKFIHKQCYSSKYPNFKAFIKFDPCIVLNLFLDFSYSEPDVNVALIIKLCLRSKVKFFLVSQGRDG